MSGVVDQVPVVGTVEFVQHVRPGLVPGTYRLAVSQDVSAQATAPDNSYFFAVQGPRFSIDRTEVVATYPPDLATGEFDGTLPHVVLTNRTLPWQRLPTTAEPERTFPGGEHDRDVPTWLAVLVFDAEDEAAFPGFQAQAGDGALRDLFLRRTTPDPAQVYSYFWAQPGLGPDSTGLAEHLDHGQTPDDPCRVLDVPLGLFWRVAPSVGDLMMTAHVRVVDVVRKATQNGVPAGRTDLSAVPGTSEFALVFGGRLPRPGARQFAHLVSLEGLEPFLPRDAATGDDPAEVVAPDRGPDGVAIGPGGSLRLVSLLSWSFTSTGDSTHFERLLLGLRPKTDASATTPADFSIGLPAPDGPAGGDEADTLARTALGRGFTPLRHRTRDGGRTVSWYRGPLVPSAVAPDLLPPTVSSSDAATRYDPRTGMFDVGYAAAWQIGRLLAVQDARFCARLCEWRRQNLRRAVAGMEARTVARTLDDARGDGGGDGDLVGLLRAFAPPVPPETGTPAVPVEAGLTGSRGRRADAHRAALSSVPGLGSLLGDDLDVPPDVLAWLARLTTLDGVPFRYLVPDEAMLPPESIRFFHLDPNWMHALRDGALSVGRPGAGDAPAAVHDAAVQALVHDGAGTAALTRRADALGVPGPDPRPLDVVTGFLLRSDVVAGWPGLEVNGYAADGTQLDIVRFERLAPTVLVCLFESGGRTLHHVDVHEPAEGLHFGLSGGGTTVDVRTNHATGDRGAGSQVPGLLAPVPRRGPGGDERVVRMFRLARVLRGPAYAAAVADIYQGFDHLPSSQFALQMLRGVGKVTFGLDGSAS